MIEENLFEQNSEDLECNSDREASLDPCSKIADFADNQSSTSSDSSSQTIGETPVFVFRYTTPGMIQKYVIDYGTPKGEEIYFCRISFPPHKKIKEENNKFWESLRQKKQYGYITSKFRKYESDVDPAIKYIIGIFEQFKTGNLHLHLFVNTKDGIHNFKADMLTLFEITKKDELKNFFSAKLVTDLPGLLDYMFDKKEKNYEIVDQNIFKPFNISIFDIS